MGNGGGTGKKTLHRLKNIPTFADKWRPHDILIWENVFSPDLHVCILIIWGFFFRSILGSFHVVNKPLEVFLTQSSLIIY